MRLEEALTEIHKLIQREQRAILSAEDKDLPYHRAALRFGIEVIHVIDPEYEIQDTFTKPDVTLEEARIAKEVPKRFQNESEFKTRAF